MEIPWQDWQNHHFSLSNLRQHLLDKQPDIFGLRHVPNARLNTETLALEWLDSDEPTETVGHWRKTLSKHSFLIVRFLAKCIVHNI